jgi:intracellular sulfur oxidation DsrE/DsrF family protein
MKPIKKISVHGVALFLFTLAFIAFNTHAGEFFALKGLHDIKAVFDVRSKSVKTAAIQLDLIHQTYYEQNIRNASEKPAFAVVFGGAAVKLISTDREGYSDEEKMLLGLIADKATAMAKDGIRLEVCLFAADVHDVEPETLLPGIHHVDNGWISLIGYQAKGYSLVSVF